VQFLKSHLVTNSLREITIDQTFENFYLHRASFALVRVACPLRSCNSPKRLCLGFRIWGLMGLGFGISDACLLLCVVCIGASRVSTVFMLLAQAPVFWVYDLGFSGFRL